MSSIRFWGDGFRRCQGGGGGCSMVVSSVGWVERRRWLVIAAWRFGLRNQI